MGNVDIWQASLNGGELTPLVEGREDISRYPTGCRRLRNAHGLIQGPARRRMGGLYTAPTKSNGNAWLVPFIRSRQLAYVLEFGENYIRFFRNRAAIESSPGVPYEIVSPWTYAQLTAADGTFALRLTQSIDVLFIADGLNPVQQLSRFADTNWTLTDFDTVGGPFDAENTDPTITIYASAQTGVVTLTASTAIFTSDRIGSLLRLQPKDLRSAPPWEPHKSVTTNQRYRNDGKTYNCVAGTTPAVGPVTGTIAPIHEQGREIDGSGMTPDPDDNTSPAMVTVGVQWDFEDPGYGVAKITAVGGGGTTATATVSPWRVGSNAVLPFYTVLVGNATPRWSWGLFSDAAGHPTDVSFFRERFVLGGARQYAFSVPNGFTEFAQELAGQVLADNAFVAELTSDRDETTQWIKPAHDVLLIGTTGGEHMLAEMTPNQVFGPLNRKSEPKTGYGSNGTAPVRCGDQVLFVEANGTRVRATKADGGAFAAPSQNDLAEHITLGGVIAQAYQEKPDSLAWFLTADGRLPCLTFSAEQDVFGWSSHFIGGFRDASHTRSAKVTSIAVIPSPDGTADDLWYIAERRINGATKRYIEVAPSPTPRPQQWEYETAEAFKRRVLDWQADLVFADSGATYDVPLTITNVAISGGGVVTITSAGHGLSNGDRVRIDGVVGTWQINARSFIIENVTVNTFDLDAVDGTDFDAYGSGGIVREMVTTITGLGPWEGETLQVITDGAVHPDRVVTGGAITLQYPGARVHTGYNARMLVETMRPIGGNERGSAQGKHGTITRVILRVEATLGGKIGPDDDHLDVINYRVPADPMGIAVPAHTGDLEIDFPDGGDDTVRTIVFVQDQPLPATVVSFGTEQSVDSD
jgi:Ubiquitin-activating enzyme E1 FCCH domain